MDRRTRRDLLIRLTALAAAGYVAPRAVRIDPALADHKGPPCSLPPCDKKKKRKRRRRRRRREKEE